VVFLFQKSLTDKNQMCVVLPSIEGLDLHVATMNELKIYKFVHSIGELIFDAVTLNSMALQCLYCTDNYYFLKIFGNILKKYLFQSHFYFFKMKNITKKN
jgi:hypothetical protein